MKTEVIPVGDLAGIILPPEMLERMGASIGDRLFVSDIANGFAFSRWPASKTAYIYFSLVGDFDPYELAATIPLQFTECTAKHSHNPTREIPKQAILHYAEVETSDALIDIYQLSERAVDLLETHTDVFKKAISQFGATATFQVVIYFPLNETISTPAIGFSQRVLSFIAATGASIDIDTYRR
jgi:hypothetical protein